MQDIKGTEPRPLTHVVFRSCQHAVLYCERFHKNSC